VDEELQRRLRDLRAGHLDVGLAAAVVMECERRDRALDAWRALVERVCQRRSAERGPLVAVIRDLAARQRQLLVRELRALEPGRAWSSLRALAGCGEVPVLVVLGCERSYDPGGQSTRRGAHGALKRLLPDRFRSYPMPDSLSPILLSMSGCLVTERVLARRRQGWVERVNELVAFARATRSFELAPWLEALFFRRSGELASSARAAFAELTGREHPPLDVLDLASRIGTDASRGEGKTREGEGGVARRG
jgi:hypothetical protein